MIPKLMKYGGAAICTVAVVYAPGWWLSVLLVGILLTVSGAMSVLEAKFPKGRVVFIHDNGQRIVLFGEYPELCAQLKEAGFRTAPVMS